jgi:cell filamentation protein
MSRYDADDTYCYPGTDVLRNKAEIANAEDLDAYEGELSTLRSIEILENPIAGQFDLVHLQRIHLALFQDVYEWAGKIRTVNISKDGKPFFDGERFQTGFQYINSLIVEYSKISSNRDSEIARKLAEILDNINFMHPFREGNGRTQREFIRTLALQKGFKLNLNPPNNKSIYNRYMNGTIHSDVKLLKELILEELIKIQFN